MQAAAAPDGRVGREGGSARAGSAARRMQAPQAPALQSTTAARLVPIGLRALEKKSPLAAGSSAAASRAESRRGRAGAESGSADPALPHALVAAWRFMRRPICAECEDRGLQLVPSSRLAERLGRVVRGQARAAGGTCGAAQEAAPRPSPNPSARACRLPTCRTALCARRRASTLAARLQTPGRAGRERKALGRCSGCRGERAQPYF